MGHVGVVNAEYFLLYHPPYAYITILVCIKITVLFNFNLGLLSASRF